MAKDTAKWVGLSEVIYQYIDQARLSNSDYRRLWTIGVRGVEEMGMDVYGTTKTVKLVVNANKTVTLPSDYVGFSKVGIFNQKGEVSTLRRNKNLNGGKFEGKIFSMISIIIITINKYICIIINNQFLLLDINYKIIYFFIIIYIYNE